MSDERTDAEIDDASMRYRRAINDALGALLGAQSNQAFLAYSFEDALDDQVERIEGAGTQQRPNLLTRVDRVEQQLLQVVRELKALPIEQTRRPTDKDVGS